MRHLAVALTSVIAITALSVPAHAADQGAIHFFTSDASISVSGGTVTYCDISDSDNAIAEFDVAEMSISINLRDGRGGIAVVGDQSYEATIDAAVISADEKTISLSGSSDDGVDFTLNAACTDTK